MLGLTFDISQVVEAYALNKQSFEAIAQASVEAATFATYEQIHKEANSALKSTRRIYKQNINYPQIGRLKGSITLTGQLPNAIEQGMPPFDMKDGFSKSAKARRSKKGGWYLTIPFRFAVQGSLGESEAFSGVLPAEVQELAKGLTPTRTAFGMTIQKGQGVSQEQLTAIGFGQLGFRAKVKGGNLTAAQAKGYKHKSSIYAGVVRQVKFYEKAQSGRYNTFRRVSGGTPTASAQNSWIHKGISARNLMPKAMQNAQLQEVVTRVVNSAVRTL